MIKAKHSKCAKFLFHHYIMNLLKHHFQNFHLLGDIPKTDPNLPLMLLPNHSTWWDGFFVYLLNEKLFRRPIYLMMLEEQLKKYHFFCRVGAYSIEPDNPKSMMRTLKYTVDILNSETSPPPLVCIFPQGELVPWGKRPLNLKSGVDWIIKKIRRDVNLLPLGMKIEYLGQKRADVFFQCGENSVVNVDNYRGARWIENKMEIILENMTKKIAKEESGTLIFL